MQIMHFILDKILKLLIGYIARLSIVSRCKIIWSQNSPVFWPTLYTRQFVTDYANYGYDISQVAELYLLEIFGLGIWYCSWICRYFAVAEVCHI